MAGALIVTAELGAEDFAWLDRLRRAHFPAERNVLAAHLTMFHTLPPSVEAEARTRLKAASAARKPKASLEGLMNLGGGVAYRVVSTDLDRIREELASDFYGLLSAQDAGGWRPHVTIQNKVQPATARAHLASHHGEDACGRRRRTQLRAHAWSAVFRRTRSAGDDRRSAA